MATRTSTRLTWLVLPALMLLIVSNMPAVATAGGLANASTAPANATKPVVTTIFVSALDVDGVETGVKVKRHKPVIVSATGDAFGGDLSSDPDGVGPCHELCLAPSEPAYALVAKVGDGPWTLVGTGPTIVTGKGGLVLAFNDHLEAYEDNSGGYSATVTVTKIRSIK